MTFNFSVAIFTVKDIPKHTFYISFYYKDFRNDEEHHCKELKTK